MRRLGIFSLEIIVGFTLNLTAPLFDKRMAMALSRWFWLVVLLHGTYLLFSSEAGKRTALRIRAQFGEKTMASFIVIAVSCAVLGSVYWFGINSAYARLFSSPGPAGINGPRDLQIELAPYILINRMFANLPEGRVKFVKYGLSAILRVRNNGAEQEYVRELRISGRIRADPGLYISTFGHEGADVAALLRNFEEKKPFYTLSWTLYPKGQTEVNSRGDEQFPTFEIVSLGPAGTGPTISAVDSDRPFRDYFGFGANEPHALVRTPYLFALVDFRGTADSELRNPRLRSEVLDGSVKVEAVIGDTVIPISTNHITTVGFISDAEWSAANPREMFFSAKHGDRSIPTAHDPARND